MPDEIDPIAQEIADRRKRDAEIQAERRPDPIADRIASRRKVALASSINAGQAANADTRAKAMALADQMRLPVDVVERNLADVAAKARASEYDMAAIQKNHPDLANWLSKPDHAAVSNDDLPAMRAIDVATRSLRGDDPTGVLPPGFLFSGGAITEPLGDGSLGNEYKTIADLQKELTRRGERHDWEEWERQTKAQELKDRWGPLAVAGGGAEAATISTLQALNFGGRDRANYLDRMGEQSSQASATLDPSIWGDFQRGLGGVAADLPLMFSGGPIVKGMQSLTKIGRARSLVTALEKATPGNRSAGGAFSRLSAERGAAKGALATAEGGALLTGRAADVAKTALAVQPLAIREGINSAEDNGVANGAMSWLIETAIPGAFGRTGLERAIVPGASTVAAKGWRGVVAQGLKDAGYEATEEAITEWAHAVHEVASGIDPQALDPDRLGRRLLVAGAVGGVAGGAAQIPIAIAEKMYGDQEEARRATVHADRLMELTNKLSISKTNERAAPAVKEAIEKSLGQSDRFQYVDAQDFREAFADPAAVAASMGLTKEYAEALAAGAPLKIPTATLVQAAATDISAVKLLGKARRSPDAWHAEQAAEFTEKAPDEIRRLQAEAKASAVDVAKTPQDEEETLRNRIRDVLMKAGQDPVRAATNATLQARNMAAFAKRSGKSATDLYEKYLNDNIKKVLPKLLKGEKFDLVDSMLERIRSGDVPSDKEINGPSLVDFLRAKGINDSALAGELKSLKESDNTRLPGEKSLIRDDGIDLDTARQLAAERGYISRDATLNDFMAALDNEIRGSSPSYIENGGDPNKRAVRDSLDQMEAALREAGIDVFTATNKQAREALAKMMEGEEGSGQEYNQTDAGFVIGDLPRDMREELYNLHATSVDPDAKEQRFYRKRVFSGSLPVSAFGETDTFNDETLQRYAKGDRGELPPVVIADGKLIDGQHRIAAARKSGQESIRYIDLSGLLNPAETGYISDVDMSQGKSLNQGSSVVAPRSGRLDLDAILKQWRKATGDRTPIGGDAAFQALAEESDKVDRGRGRELFQSASENDWVAPDKNKWSSESEKAATPENAIQSLARVSLWKRNRVQEEVDWSRKDAAWYIRQLGMTMPEFWDKYGDRITQETNKIAKEYADHVARTPNLDGFRDALNSGASEYRLKEMLKYDLGVDLDEEISKGFKELDQPKQGKGPRGSLVFGKTGTPFTIKLFQSENLSTFAHESAHLSLEILGDLATAEGAAPDLVDDFRKVREWFKVNSADIRKQARDLAKDRGASAPLIVNGIEGMTDAEIAAIADDFVSAPANGTAGSFIHEAMHEYFARGWEGYLLEGKAPTASLRSVFARAKGWMEAIYKVVKTLRVELSPEIRGVFDRLVAIEEEVDAAEDRAGTKDILPAEAFPDFATFDAYRRSIQDSRDAAEASLQRQLISDYTKEWTKAQNEQREEIRAEIAEQVNAQPVYQVIAALQRAQLPEGGQVDAYVGLKLDRAELARGWGEKVFKTLPGPSNISENEANRGAVVYANEGGTSIATVAQMFGFSDPSALIEAMNAAPDRRSLIETQTEKRMRAEHPDPLLDGSLPERATAAIHNEERGELLARELRALGMKTGQTPAPVAVLREFARTTIEKQLARDLRPAIYKQAAGTARRRMTEAAGKQDWSTAYVEGQREALNLEMYRASQEAKEAGEKSRDYLRSLNTLAARQRIGKAGGWEFTVFDENGEEVKSYPKMEEARDAVLPGQTYTQTNGYLEQIYAIQDGYSLRRTSNKKLRKGARMRKWMAEQQKEDPEFEISDRITTDLDVGNVNWNDLTVEQQAEVVDAVRSIENQAKLKNKLLKAKGDRDLAARMAEGAASILANKKGTAPKDQQGDTVSESAARSGKGFLGWHRKDSFLLRKMDGYQDAGAMWELIQQPRNDAATEEETRNLVNAAKVEAIFKKWGKGLGWTRQEIPGTKLRLTLEHRIAMALNWGHAEGRRRILRQLETDGMDIRDVQAVLDSLDESDFAMVDEMITLINSHWSDVASLEQRLNGIPPEKVKALPWSTRNPTTGKVVWHQGGYYPLKYDAEKSKRAGDAALKAALMENASAAGAKGYTRRSHTKQRADDVLGLVVDLSLDVAGKHLAEVVHDLTHREMVRDQLRLLKEGTPIVEAIIQKHGIAKWKQLVETTGAIATRDVQPDTKVSRFVQMIRRGNTAAVFTYSLSSALMNLTGVLSSIARVGPLRLLSAMSSVTKDAATMEWAGTWVQGKSDMMKVRGGNNIREVSEALRDVGHLSALQKTIRIGYLPMQKVVQLVDTITWIAAYRQHMDAALANGKTESEADEQAIAVADQTVIDTQGSGRIGDLAAIQRGGEFAKLFTMFYGYFSVQANLIGEQYGRAREDGGAQWIKSATTVLMLGPVSVILTNLIKAALRGDERDEDVEKMAKRMAREQLGTAAGMLVGVREVSSSIETGFNYGGPASLSAIGNATDLIQDVKQGDLDGIAKGVVSTVGSLTGAPSRVANQAIDAFLQFEEDGKGGRALRTLLFGKPLKDSR